MSILDSPFPAGFSPDYNWELVQANDEESQRLLADAFKANARMPDSSDGLRIEESEKRKLHELEDDSLAKNGPTKSSHNEFRDSVLHDSEDDSLDGKSDHDEPTKRVPKKPGRKPLAYTPLVAGDPKQKRKAQNRAAQRAFRERKERYVKELEERIKELESRQSQSNAQIQAENTQLKSLIQKLETENYLLKGANFTFDFPIGGKVGSIVEIAATTATTNTGQNQWTPPSPGNSDGQNDSEPTSPTDSGISGSPSSMNQEEKSPQDVLNSTFSEPQSATSIATSSSLQSVKLEEQERVIMQLLREPIFSTDLQLSLSNASHVELRSPPPLIEKQGSFTEYREPSPYHNPFSDSASIPPLFQNDLDNYGTLAPMGTPSIEVNDIFATTGGPVAISTLSPSSPSVLSSSSSSGNSNSNSNSTEGQPSFVPGPARFTHPQPDNQDKGKMVSFKQAWEKISGHPRFEEIDMDKLCDDLKSKAKCSGHGPAVEEKDVNNVLKRLDERS